MASVHDHLHHDDLPLPPGLREPFQIVTAADAVRLITTEPKITVFDVRDLNSYKQETLKGAMHLSEDRVSAWIERLPRDLPILLFCYHGKTAKTMARKFGDARFQRVYSLEGGYRQLANAMAERPQVSLPAAASAALRDFLNEWQFDAEDLNRPRQHGLTPLMRAALQGDVALVNELLAAGVEVNLRNGDGNNALWLACVARDEAIVRRLAAAGIAMDNVNDAGATPLMYCASAGRDDMLALLLELGADAWLCNPDGLRAVDMAASRACLRLLRHTVDQPAAV